MAGGYSGVHYLSVGGEGQNTDVDNAAEVLTSSTQAVAVDLKALEGNSGVIYYNTTTTATETNGYPLGAGDSSGWIPVPGNDLTNISVISSAANQGIAFRYLR